MSALGTIAQQLVAALQPLENALTDPAAFRALMLRLGWRASQIPAGWSALATDVSTIANAVEGLADDPSLDDVTRAVAAAADLRSHLSALTTAPPGIDPATLIGELRDLLVQRLVIEQLARGAPRTFGLLVAFGLIRFEPQPSTADRPACVRYSIDLDQLSALVQNPSQLAKLAFSWGTDQFDADTVTNVLFDLIARVGLPVRLERTDDGTLPGFSTITIGRSYLRVPVLDVVIDNTATQLGISIAIVPPDSGGPGIVLAPWIPGLTQPLVLGPYLQLQIVTGGGQPLDLGLALTPAGFDVHYPGSGGSLPAGGIGVEATITQPGGLGAGTGSRFALDGITLGLYLDDDAQGVSCSVVAKLDNAHVVLSGSDQDGVVGMILGGKDLQLPFPIGLSWSSRTGFDLTLGPGTFGAPGTLILGPVQLDHLALAFGAVDKSLSARVSARVTVSLGPVTVMLDQLGGAVALDRSVDGSLGLGALSASPVFPTSAGLSIDASVVKGSGVITRDPASGRYAGGVQLTIFGYQVLGAAILDTKTPEGQDLVSFVGLVAARFPGIPLGLGFLLDGFGGLFALHRRADDSKLQAAIRSGGIAALLLPDDPKLGLANLLTQLGTLFPVEEGRYLGGPSARIGWGTPRAMAADVMVLLELPSPVRVILLSSVEVGLPTLDKRVVDIRLDAVGILDLARQTLALDASLHDSKIAGYTLTGDMSLRMGWGSDSDFLLAIGGFHPKFTPPPGFPMLRRLQVTAGDNPQLRLQTYLAITSNTAQVGAQADLAFKGGGFTISANAGFDALFVFTPFQFDVDIQASAAISWHGHNLASVALDFELTGPHPWHAVGSASFSILWWSPSVGFDTTWGDATPDALPPPPDVAAALRQALGDTSAWQSQLPADEPTWLVLATTTTPKPHPLAAVAVRQHVVPLGIPVTEFGSIPLAAPMQFAIASVTVGSTAAATATVTDAFAPGQFTQLSNDQKLAAPSFEQFDSGVIIGGGVSTAGALARASLAEDTLVIDPLAPPPPPPLRTGITWTTVSWLGAARAQALLPVRSGPALDAVNYVLASTTTLAKTGSATTYAAANAGRTIGLQIIPIAHAG